MSRPTNHLAELEDSIRSAISGLEDARSSLRAMEGEQRVQGEENAWERVAEELRRVGVYVESDCRATGSLKRRVLLAVAQIAEAV